MYKLYIAYTFDNSNDFLPYPYDVSDSNNSFDSVRLIAKKAVGILFTEHQLPNNDWLYIGERVLILIAKDK